GACACGRRHLGGGGPRPRPTEQATARRRSGGCRRRARVASKERARGGSMELEIKRFDAPDETRAFDRGTFEVVEIGGMTVGRARYEPGWKWSEHVGAISGTAMCEVEHLGLVVSGRAAVAMNDG